MAERGEAYREYQRAYYQAHKEVLQKRHREYYWENREQQLKYYWENREQQLKRKRKHYLANREKICKAARERYYKLKAERMEKGEEKLWEGEKNA